MKPMAKKQLNSTIIYTYHRYRAIK